MSYFFLSRVYDIPVQVEVLHYRPSCPMRITGTGMGDAVEGESEEFDFALTCVDGQESSLLDKATEDLAVYKQLLSEYLKLV